MNTKIWFKYCKLQNINIQYQKTHVVKPANPFCVAVQPFLCGTSAGSVWHFSPFCVAVQPFLCGSLTFWSWQLPLFLEYILDNLPTEDHGRRTTQVYSYNFALCHSPRPVLLKQRLRWRHAAVGLQGCSMLFSEHLLSHAPVNFSLCVCETRKWPAVDGWNRVHNYTGSPDVASLA